MGFAAALTVALVLMGDVPERTGSAVIVLEFDGGELLHTPGEASNPYLRTTPFGECEGDWSALEDLEIRDAVLLGVDAAFAEFDVIVTENEPCDGPFILAMAGPADHCGSGLGYAESECSRNVGHGIVFARIDPEEHTVPQMVAVIAHEVGHAYGLGHVDNPADFMHASIGTGEDKSFQDVCAFSSGGGSENACPIAGRCPFLDPVGTNTYSGLMDVLGPIQDAPTPPACLAGSPEGCGCRASPHAFAWTVMLGLVGLRARRTSRRSTGTVRPS